MCNRVRVPIRIACAKSASEPASATVDQPRASIRSCALHQPRLIPRRTSPPSPTPPPPTPSQ
eukprot:12032577-Prorocentrum_lima.AAC.1